VKARVGTTILAAVAGLAVAIGLAFVASDLTTQQVGLGGEDPGAGEKLAPSSASRARAKPTPPRTLPTTTATTTTTTAAAPPPPATTTEADDDSGRGRGRGRGGDDEGHELEDGDD
jgi:hypothetical protein